MYITTTINRDDVDIEIEVELSYRRGSPPSWEHPGDPDEMEIEDISPDGIELTTEEEEKIIKLAFEKVANDHNFFDQDAPDDTYDL